MAIATGEQITAADVLAIAGTFEKFYPATVGESYIVPSAYGKYAVIPIVGLGYPNNLAFITGHVPHDFGSVVELVAVVIPNGTSATFNLDISSMYAAAGEAYNANGESDAASTYNLTENQMTEIDLSGIFSSIAAGDYFGVLIENHGAFDLKVLGVRLKYSTS